jgi:hypothetical protein
LASPDVTSIATNESQKATAKLHKGTDVTHNRHAEEVDLYVADDEVKLADTEIGVETGEITERISENR